MINNIARLNFDGTTDNSFNVNVDNVVYDLALQSDGKILIGGDFERVDGLQRTSVARLLTEPQVACRTSFDFDGDGRADISVYRPGSGFWYILKPNSSYSAAQLGDANDKLVPADYDGDGKTDIDPVLAFGTCSEAV
jgi:Domain of unknown function (DUF5122) beta-propeller/FG-GAP-like repeat